MAGMALWITGLPGSGKSALAERLKKAFPRFVVLRMDELRSIATPRPSYSDAERDVLYRSLIFTAKKLADLGHDVLIDATGNRRKWRELARRTIGRYREVYLECPVEVCRAREEARVRRRGAPRGVYRKAEAGWPVPGAGAPYETPRKPELTLNSAALSLAEELDEVKGLMGKPRKGVRRNALRAARAE